MEDFLDKRSEGVKYAAFKEATERRAELGAQLDAETGLALALAKHRAKHAVKETRRGVFFSDGSFFRRRDPEWGTAKTASSKTVYAKCTSRSIVSQKC